jgi:hypothetical protein
MSEEIKKKLDELADLQLGQDTLKLRKQEEIDNVMSPEDKAIIDEINKKNLIKIAEIDERYAGEAEALASKISVLDLDIRKAVLTLGASVKGGRLYAIWNKGRVSWDTRKLDGYAEAHPEIKQFRVEGEPTISIRPVVMKVKGE